MTTITNKTLRNSILEIGRFLGALWIMHQHNFTTLPRETLANGNLAVDFFFMLSGFFFTYSCQKYTHRPFIRALLAFEWHRLKPIAATFFICWAVALSYYFQLKSRGIDAGVFGFLWFIPVLLYVLATYFGLWRICQWLKSPWLFKLVLVFCVIVSYKQVLTNRLTAGAPRGYGAIALGILLSTIPPLKYSTLKRYLPYITVLLSIFFTVFLAWINPEDYHWQKTITLIILFPTFIYFAAQCTFKNKYINTICSLSFGLYAYQTVARSFRGNKILTEDWQLCLLVIILAILDLIITKTVKYFLNKKTNSQIHRAA